MKDDPSTPSYAFTTRLSHHVPKPSDESPTSVSAFRDDALFSPLISTGQNGLRGDQAVRSPKALRLHPAFNELNLNGWLINAELEGRRNGVREPILTTRSGIVLAGFGEWHTALCAAQAVINCIEFELDDDRALQLILTLYRPRAAWNDFTRTELALEQQPHFQSKALANQIAGGKQKGLANLPKADQIDVRKKIADLAGVSARTVGNVKTIRKKAHPCLIQALHNRTITINGALQLCKHERSEQLEQLARFLGKRCNNKTNREYIDKLRTDTLGADLIGFLANLQQFEASNPGLVEIRSGKGKKTVIIVGKSHLAVLSRATPAGLV
jgi:hypothetical protein